MTLQGSLRTPGGLPLSGQSVTILAGPSLASVGTATTDTNGDLNFVTAGISSTTNFALRWAANTTYSAIASRVISITSTAASVPRPPATIPSGSHLLVTAHITDSAGRAIIGRTVALQFYPSGGGFTVMATGTTNTSGNLTLDGGAITAATQYAVRLSADPSTNGDPDGAAASAIYSVGVS